jgi:ABC-2 type transport system ATP-binding protein
MKQALFVFVIAVSMAIPMFGQTEKMENIYKSFRDKGVLKGISIRMENGVYGLLGPNGAGKTTMIRILEGITRPTGGQVFFNGQDKNTCGDEYRAKIGYLPQNMSFYPDFSGWDYLQYAAALKGISIAQARRACCSFTTAQGIAAEIPLQKGRRRPF